MKALRVWLLLLLAVLLPVRGAVAAAMLCPPGAVGIQTEVRVSGNPVGHHGGDDGSSHHDHASHDHGSHRDVLVSADADSADPQDVDMSSSTTDKCDACSAFCSVTPLISSAPTLPELLLAASAEFPALSAPAPTFLSDGQDRPPRSN